MSGMPGGRWGKTGQKQGPDKDWRGLLGGDLSEGSRGGATREAGSVGECQPRQRWLPLEDAPAVFLNRASSAPRVVATAGVIPRVNTEP